MQAVLHVAASSIGNVYWLDRAERSHTLKVSGTRVLWLFTRRVSSLDVLLSCEAKDLLRADGGPRFPGPAVFRRCGQRGGNWEPGAGGARLAVGAVAV